MTDTPAFTIQIQALQGSGRRFTGVASDLLPDNENEVVEKAAMETALEWFMHLPVVDYFHTGIPVGLITKAEYRGGDLDIEGRIKETPDADPVWAALVKGELSQLSIWGRRTAGSPECRLAAGKRRPGSPCVTKGIVLYTISLCPLGTAVNPRTHAEVLKALTSTGTSLIHPTVDGTPGERHMPNLNDDENQTEQTGGNPPADAPPTDTPAEDTQIEKTEDPAPEPTLGDVVVLLKEVLQRLPAPAEAGVMKANTSAPDPGAELKKAQDRIVTLETDLRAMTADRDKLKKAIQPPKTIVLGGDAGKAAPSGAGNVRAIERLI